MEPETLDLVLELKGAAFDDEAGTFEGIASPFGGEPDRVGDVVAPGCFTRTLKEHKAAGTMPGMLLVHDPRAICGAWLHIEEAPGGLKVKGRFALCTPWGDEAYALAKAKAAVGLSIGYRTRKASRLPGGFRRLEDVDLIEISVLATPATLGGRITSVKSYPAAAAAQQHEAKGMAEQTTATNDAAEDTPLADRVTAIERTVADIDKRLKVVEGNADTAAKGVQRIESILRRPGAAATEQPNDGASVERKAFESYVRRGMTGMESTEVKTMRTADDASAGYLAPAEFVAEVDKNIVLWSPVRGIATVRNTSRGSVQVPKRIGRPTATWVEELEDRDDTGTESRYGNSDYPVKELTAFVDVSLSTLEDGAIDIFAELAGDLAEEFGSAEGQAFVTGNGVKRPMGFMTDNTIPLVKSGHASQITADSIIDLYHAVPTPYRANAVWSLNSTTLGTIRKLKDGNGQYLALVQGINGAPVTTILGRPVVEMPDMPDVAGNACPVVFGDFKQGYRVFDRVGFSILRDELTQRTKGKVRFHARKRVAGGVRKAEALRKLIIAAS